MRLASCLSCSFQLRLTRRFSELFPARVGLSPQNYLRKWRLTLARRDVQAGHQVQSVARKLGYSSGEALTRAFKREFGAAPRFDRMGLS